jgi:hypothetical protein
LEKFLDELIEAKQYPPTIPQGFKDQIKSDLRPLLTKAINLNLVVSLPNPDQQAINKLIDGDATDEEIQKFLDERIKNQEYIIAKTLIRFRSKYLGTT